MFEKDHSLGLEINMIQTNQLVQLPLLATDVAKAIEEDKILSQVYQLIQEGWPEDKLEVDKTLQPYFSRQLQLTIQNGCILNGLQVVIPQILRKDVLAELHKAHIGIVERKSVAKTYVWWPSINVDIENCIHECKYCQLHRNNPVKALSHPWDVPKHPWERVHIDFPGPFKGHVWLILVDALTKWLEVIQMSTTSSEHTVVVLRSLFTRYGLP